VGKSRKTDIEVCRWRRFPEITLATGSRRNRRYDADMKREISCTVLFFFLPQISLSQPFMSAQASGQRVHLKWNLQNAEELDYKRTIANSSELTGFEKTSLLSAIAALVHPFMADNEITSETELAQLVKNTRVKLVDLDGDGKPEVIAQASDYKLGCGATGNCALWVFKKTATGYNLILDTRDRDGIGGIELLTIAETRTGAFRDLILASHLSANEKSIEVYRFKNGSYRETDRYLANWEYIAGGKLRSSKKPLISSGCS
jgi:hypothetical protein